jgi:hypothetical protein
MDISAYVNKTVPFKFSGAELRFDLSHALFSSFDIDRGTKLLLKAVAHDPVLARSRRVLDEGCGVGVIGLSIAEAFPGTHVVLRDRDSLAVAFTERNRRANRIGQRAAAAVAGEADDVSARPVPSALWACIASRISAGNFDFVLSNLPAKAGGPVLASFFSSLTGSDGGSPLLAQGGRAAVVIVEPLALQAEAWIDSARLRILERARGADHVVFVIEPADALPRGGADGAASSFEGTANLGAFDLGPYKRCTADFALADLRYRAAGFWGLPEFDTPSFASSAAAELAARVFAGPRIGDLLVIDPGVGHFALWASRSGGCRSITAASRDILALAASAANIADLPPTFRPRFAALDELELDDLPESSFDVIADFSVGVPELDQSPLVWERASRLLRSGGIFLAVRGPAEMARLERRRPTGRFAAGPSGRPLPQWTMLGRRRKRTMTAAAWRMI